MRNSVTPFLLRVCAASAAGLFAALLAGCPTTSSDGGAGGMNGSAGGAQGSAGNTGTTGTGGAAPVTCSNTDKSIIPIDSTGWVARQCNNYDIQGAFYCYTDGMTQTDCMTNKTPWNAAQGGMCISGTSLGTTAAYGAAIGLSLNDSGGTNPTKGAYDASTHNIVGFEVTVTGNLGGLKLRFGFHGTADVSPFYEIIGPGTYQVMFNQAQVPANWTVPNAGTSADPTALYDLQFQIAGDSAANKAFNYCITSLKPIVSGGTTGTGGASGSSCGTLSPIGGGASQCNALDVINNVGNYAVQNDVYNPMGGSQCITATAGGGCAGFTATPTLNVSGNTPGSYGSIVYGWHYGNVYGTYRTPKQVSAITSVPSSWQFTVPAVNATPAVKYDVSYDIWVNQAGGNPGQPDANTLELMVWLDETPDAVPAGTTSGQTASIGGQTWQIYSGTMSTWHYIAYKRAASTTPFTNVDLKAFMTDATTRNVGITTSWYLLSVEAGFEIWKGANTQPFVTNAYSVTVN